VNNDSLWLKYYSYIFVVVVLGMFLGQTFVPGMTLDLISENYLWKKSLIKIYSSFRYQIGDRVFTGYIVGKEGWIYFSEDLSIQNYQKTYAFNMGNIKRLTELLNKIDDQTREYGGELIVVVAPDKSTIYPQYMPDEIVIIGQASNLDRLIEYVNKNSDVQMLDLRPVLSEASRSEEIYYKTDTHWNCLGGFYASNEILSKISASYPDIQPHTLNDFTFSTTSMVMDIPNMMGWDIEEKMVYLKPRFETDLSIVQANDLHPKNQPLEIKINSRKDLPELMVFHDSFYACLGPFIEPNFSRTISTHFKDAELPDYLDMISSEQPDIVIIEFVERYMDFFYTRLRP
jgi:alginate O-acetyltransferase complex protein AlgJ